MRRPSGASACVQLTQSAPRDRTAQPQLARTTNSVGSTIVRSTSLGAVDRATTRASTATAPKQTARLTNRGEGRVEVPRQRDVVETGHRDVVGNTTARALGARR